jgi:class 3 adenylate cyclase
VSFEDVIRRQLDMFEEECADLIADCDAAVRAYDAAGRDEAEERYAEYLDLIETGTERLAELRDNLASTMTEIAAEDYEQEFNAAVQKRLPRFALQIDDV